MTYVSLWDSVSHGYVEETKNPLQRKAADEILPMSWVIKGLTLDNARAFSSNVQVSVCGCTGITGRSSKRKNPRKV